MKLPNAKLRMKIKRLQQRDDSAAKCEDNPKPD